MTDNEKTLNPCNVEHECKLALTYINGVALINDDELLAEAADKLQTHLREQGYLNTRAEPASTMGNVPYIDGTPSREWEATSGSVETVHEALALHRSMSLSGEQPSKTSEECFDKALTALSNLIDRDKFIKELEGMKVHTLDESTGFLHIDDGHNIEGVKYVRIEAAIKLTREV